MPKAKALNFQQYGESLPGEDRSYGGSEFYVDMIPSSAFFSNLRAMMPLSQWKELSAYVRSRSEDRCEICASGTRLEAHERWLFEPKFSSQTLKRIVCLCKQCHLSVHIGLAGQLGLRNAIDEHIMSITGWTANQLAEHVKSARNEWLVLSKIAWKMDVSMVVDAGVAIESLATAEENIGRKKDQVARQEQKFSLVTGRGTADEFVVELSAEVRKNWLVIFALTDEESVGGIPLSNTLGLSYVAKPPNSVDSGKCTLPLAKFIHAYTNPVYYKDGAHIAAVKHKPHLPLRFMLQDAGLIALVNPAKFLPLGMIFSLD